ncbi:MAG: Omp28-related outer membrane protein [Saprospiraceae bacterium]
MRFIFALLLFTSIYSSTFSQVVNKNQWTLIHERTADWCPFCGGWGWDFKESILSAFENRNVIFLAVHHSGGLQTPTSKNFTENFGGVSQPVFFEGSQSIGVNSSNMTTALDDLKAVVEYNDLNLAFAGVGITAQLDDQNTLKVDATVEILQDIPNGTYYLGLYLVEDIMHNQTGKSGLVLHENVLTKSFFTEDFGNLLGSGPIQAGKTFNFSANLPNIQSNVGNLKVAGIIWARPENDKYIFHNGNMVPVSKISSSNEVTRATFSLIGYQTESGALQVSVNSEKTMGTSTLSVFDASGKIIETLPISRIESGQNTYSLRNIYSSGIVYVTLTSGQEKITKAVVVE